MTDTGLSIRADEAALVIVNDGDGSLCGVSYKARVLAGMIGMEKVFWMAVIEYSAKVQQLFGHPPLTMEESLETVEYLMDYYKEENYEGSSWGF